MYHGVLNKNTIPILELIEIITSHELLSIQKFHNYE